MSTIENQSFILNLTIQLADNSMILGQRLGELCGHGPMLEQDIALTNIALDLIGEAKTLYEHAANIEGSGKKADDYPYLRDERLWQNILLVEQPNVDFAYAIVRQFLYDNYHVHYLKELINCKESHLTEIAQKTIKEAKYHLQFSTDWMLRLGDGTIYSNQKMQMALNDMMPYFEESYFPTPVEEKLGQLYVAPVLSKVRSTAYNHLITVCKNANLIVNESEVPQLGGKLGTHSEYLGHMLTELQYLQKSYPNSAW